MDEKLRQVELLSAKLELVPFNSYRADQNFEVIHQANDKLQMGCIKSQKTA